MAAAIEGKSKSDPAVIAGFLEDSSNLAGGRADGVFLPGDEKEALAALKECAQKNIPLTISAGQTGTTGGCIPFGGSVLSAQKLNRIITLNREERYAIVQPGVTLQALAEAAEKAGLFYPPDPTEKSATIGGTVNTNASGGRCYRFGSSRRWIRRLKILSTDGTIMEIKRGEITADDNGKFALADGILPRPAYNTPPVKSSAGYYSAPEMDLIDLFIGAEGTLGLVVEIEVELLPLMTGTIDLVAFFPNEENALDFIQAGKKSGGQRVNFYEYFDGGTLELLRPDYPLIPTGARAAVYLEEESTAAKEEDRLLFWVGLLEKSGSDPDQCWLGENQNKREALRLFRHAIPEKINEIFKQHRQIKLATDIAVPEEKFREMFDFYNLSLTPYHLQLFYIKFGHIGDNHLHVNLVARRPEDFPLAKELVLKFIKKAIELGGTVSAEHGIGKIKKEYLKLMYGESGIEEMRRIKRFFDPAGILNRGNLFDF